MKTYHLLATAAMLVLAGCSKNEITEISPDANPPIAFDIYTGAQTKGTVTDNEAGTTGIKNATGFGVLAYYTGQTPWSTTGIPNFMWNQQVTYSNSAWSYTPVKYWPNTDGDKISFFAYAPYSATPSGGSPTNGIMLPTNADATKPTITFTINNNPTNMVDLVAGFQKDQQKQTSKVNFVLKHLLSRAEFTAKLDASISSTNQTHVFITGMRILGTEASGAGGNAVVANSNSKFYNKATYDWSAGIWVYAAPNAPTKQTTPYSINNVLNLVPKAGVVSGYSTNAVEVQQDGTETTLFKNTQYLFLIPPTDAESITTDGGITASSDVRIQVDYDIVTVDSKINGGFTKTSTTATVSLPKGTLKRSKAYKYILTIGLEEVKVTAEVTDWAEADKVYVPSVDVTETTAAAVGTAITSLNTIKASNPNCDYFVVNIPGGASGAWNLTATTSNFNSGDQIDLKFSTSNFPSPVTLSGWKAGSAVNNSIILTKD